MPIKTCLICNKNFSYRGNRFNRFTCSKKCQYIRRGNILRNVKRPKWIMEKLRLAKIGSHPSKESLEKMRFSHLGKKQTEETKEKLRIISTGRKHSIEVRKKISEMFIGEKSYNWKGGITPVNNKIRKSLEYKLWRESVFKRDNWTCKKCGQRGGYLRADHIKPFAYYPEKRFDINNGRTLCDSCHKKTDTYGIKALNYSYIIKVEV